MGTEVDRATSLLRDLLKDGLIDGSGLRPEMVSRFIDRLCDAKDGLEQTVYLLALARVVEKNEDILDRFFTAGGGDALCEWIDALLPDQKETMLVGKLLTLMKRAPADARGVSTLTTTLKTWKRDADKGNVKKDEKLYKKIRNFVEKQSSTTNGSLSGKRKEEKKKPESRKPSVDDSPNIPKSEKSKIAAQEDNRREDGDERKKKAVESDKKSANRSLFEDKKSEERASKKPRVESEQKEAKNTAKRSKNTGLDLMSALSSPRKKARSEKQETTPKLTVKTVITIDVKSKTTDDKVRIKARNPVVEGAEPRHIGSCSVSFKNSGSSMDTNSTECASPPGSGELNTLYKLKKKKEYKPVLKKEEGAAGGGKKKVKFTEMDHVRSFFNDSYANESVKQNMFKGQREDTDTAKTYARGNPNAKDHFSKSKDDESDVPLVSWRTPPEVDMSFCVWKTDLLPLGENSIQRNLQDQRCSLEPAFVCLPGMDIPDYPRPPRADEDTQPDPNRPPTPDFGYADQAQD